MDINEKMEILRDYLNDLLSNEENLCKDDILKVSEELDKLIEEFYQEQNKSQK